MKLASRLYFIKDKYENKFVAFGPKIAWATSAAAKNAFALHTVEYQTRLTSKGLPYPQAVHLKLDDQIQYVLVEYTGDGVEIEL